MKKILFFAAAAIAMLASCSQNDDLTAPTVAQNAQQQTAIEFGTYMGKSAQTRAGATGNMTTATVKTNGFGVFAYYTEDDTYGSFRRSTYTAETAPGYTGTKQINFMYNQKIDDTDNDGTWTYTPLKYWPNGNAAADNIGATGTPGGNVSFFAYAPYVTKAAADADASTGTGIIGMTANNVDSDPILTYKLNDSGNSVDLLWGTLNTADNTVNNATQNGVSYDNSAADNTYKKAILPHETSPGSGTYDGYTLAADLTKQKTGGKVSFLFKHALASLGGGSEVVSSGVGFQAVLDVDAVTGGSREQFDIDASGSNDDWRTIVTIKDVKITNDLNGATDGLGDGAVGQATQGTFNLATGKWTATHDQAVSHSIGQGPDTYNAVLNAKIAEYYDNSNTWLTHAGTTAAYFNKTYSLVNDGTHPGVTETPQNVYNSTSQPPLMFIPGATAPKFKITVDYIVRTYDTSLAAGYSEVEQVITKTITFPSAFELNKHYNIIMHLGLTSVKFTATVDSWGEGHIGTAGGGSSATDDTIFLPINVE